jgi:hypothetical protein
MSYSWSLPSSLVAAPSASAPSSSSTRTVLGGLLDQEIDPVTLDFLDTDDGAWSETPDSRSIVLCQIELELGKSYATPGDGTSIEETRRSGDPLTTAFVESEIRRALGVLEAAGVIGSVEVNGRDENGDQLVDEAGRAAFEISWTDLATGSPVSDVYRPMGE